MNLACPKCRTFFRTKRVGIAWEEGMPATNDLAGPWQSYKLWAGDLRECKCGAQVILGPPGGHPIAEHYQPAYASKVTSYAPIARIDDCDGQWHEPEPPVGRIIVDTRLPEPRWVMERFQFAMPVSVGEASASIIVEPITLTEAQFMHLCKRIALAVGDGWPFRPTEPPKI